MQKFWCKKFKNAKIFGLKMQKFGVKNSKMQKFWCKKFKNAKI